MLYGMKLLKLHGWEETFCQQVLLLRKKELSSLDKDLLYRSIMSECLVNSILFRLFVAWYNNNMCRRLSI